MADFTDDARAVAAAEALGDAGGNEASVERMAESVALAADSISEITSDTVDDVLTTVSALIREKPLMAVGIAAGVAYLVGRLRS